MQNQMNMPRYSNENSHYEDEEVLIIPNCDQQSDDGLQSAKVVHIKNGLRVKTYNNNSVMTNFNPMTALDTNDNYQQQLEAQAFLS